MNHLWALSVSHLESKKPGTRSGRGFTLVELLVAMAVLALMLVMMLKVTDLTSTTVTRSSAKIDAFAAGRASFDILNQRLSQARLNTFWDYYNAAGQVRSAANAATFVAKNYGRASNLQFVLCPNTVHPYYGQELYFQAPEAYSANSNYQSTQGLLNGCSYFVRYGSDAAFKPGAVATNRYRYRLMQGMESTENLQIFQTNAYLTSYTGRPPAWTANINQTNVDTVASPVKPLSDNVIALIVMPLDLDGSIVVTNAPSNTYNYDSQVNPAPAANGVQGLTAHQLPPRIQVTLVLIDEASAARIDTRNNTPPAAIENALAGKFTVPSMDQLKVDLYGTGPSDTTSLVHKLTASHINYQILNTSVVLRESKWSK